MMLLQKLLKHELNKVWLTVMVDPIYTDDKRRFIFHYFFFIQMLLKSIDCIRFVLTEILMSDLNAVDL